jgi:hypothetical protein
VTLAQQSAAFCHQNLESPKKAAIATVFGLPLKPGGDVDLHVKVRGFGFRWIVAGVGAFKMTLERYRPKADRNKKGQGL